MALGMKKREIMTLFVIEGGFIGLFGSILGGILGGLGSWYMEAVGIPLSAFGGETYVKLSQSAYPIKDVFYGEFSFDIILATLVFGVLISIIASFYPALKATRLNPTEALRYI